MFDGQELGETIVAQVKGYLEREVTPLKAENESLKARLAALEATPGPEKGEPGEKGEDGVSPAPEAIAEAFAPLAEQVIVERVAKAVAELPPPEKGEPGKDADPLVISQIVEEEIAKALPKEWADDLTVDEKAGLLSSMLRKELPEAIIQLPEPIPFTASANFAPATEVVIHNHLPKRGVERTKVLAYDERGRISEYERREV